MNLMNRKVAGSPAGGQFAATARAESGVQLGGGPSSVLAAAREQADTAHAQLGAAQGRHALEVDRANQPGLMARLRSGKAQDTYGDVVVAQQRAKASRYNLDLALGYEGSAPGSSFDRVRHAALLAVLGDRTPTLAQAEATLAARQIAANAAEIEAAGDHGYYDEVSRAQVRVMAARSATVAARNVRDALRASQP